mgnify:CR=1 FL=1
MSYLINQIAFFFQIKPMRLRFATAEGRGAPGAINVGDLPTDRHGLSMKFIYAYDGLNRRTGSNQPGGA